MVSRIRISEKIKLSMQSQEIHNVNIVTRYLADLEGTSTFLVPKPTSAGTFYCLGEKEAVLISHSKTAHPAGRLYFSVLLLCWDALEIGQTVCVGEEWVCL